MGKIPTIESLFFNILNYSFLLFPLLFFYRFKKFTNEPTFVIIFTYSICFFLILILDPILPQDSMGLKIYYSAYTFIEYLFFLLIIWQNISSKNFKVLMLILSLAFFGFQIFYFLSYKIRKPIDAIPIAIESILIIIFCFYFFHEQLKNLTTLAIYNNYFFWTAIGLVLYLAGSFFIYILSNNLGQDFSKYWFISYIFDTIKNIFFAISAIIFLRHKNSTSRTRVISNLDY